MLVTKKKAKFLTVINLNYIWFYTFLFLVPFVGSILGFTFDFFDADFNMEKTWELVKTRPEPIGISNVRGAGFANMSTLEAFIMLSGFSVLGMVLIMCLLLYYKVMRKKSLKKQKSLANSTLELNPLGEDSDGYFFIKGLGGPSRGIGTLDSRHLEVLLNGEYLAGIIGDEGLKCFLPKGQYEITLNLVSLWDPDMVTRLRETLTGPVREPLYPRDSDLTYGLTIPIEIAKKTSFNYSYKLRTRTKLVKEKHFLKDVHHFLVWPT